MVNALLQARKALPKSLAIGTISEKPINEDNIHIVMIWVE